MLIQEAIQAWLMGQPLLAEQVKGRIFSLELPEGCTLPALVWERISTDPDYVQEGESGLVEVYFEFSSWGHNYQQAAELADALRLCLSTLKATLSSADDSETLKIESVFRVDEGDDLLSAAGGKSRVVGVLSEYRICYIQAVNA